MSARLPHRCAERGVTLVELLAALVVISIGLLALVRLFPTAARNQNEDRLLANANLYAQEKIEDLATKDWNHADLTIGRHPAGSTNESCGSTGAWQRHWDVASMAAPLDNLKKITVTVTWRYQGQRSVTATIYQRH